MYKNIQSNIRLKVARPTKTIKYMQSYLANKNVQERERRKGDTHNCQAGRAGVPLKDVHPSNVLAGPLKHAKWAQEENLASPNFKSHLDSVEDHIQH
jgi:hypothetical protein